VDEHRRRAGGRQRGGDLAAHVAALAHAHHHDTAAAGEHGFHRLGKLGALPCLEAQQGTGLDVEGVARQLQCAFGIESGEVGGLCGHVADRPCRGVH
jgi:hypothetical protein